MPRTEEANQRIREERREQILYVAVRVFAHKGLAASKIADIAAAGDMSQGLIYRHFTSKEDIFAALVERAMNATVEVVQAALEQAGSPLEKLRRFLQWSLPGLWAQPDYSLLILHTLTSDAAPREIREPALQQARLVQEMVRRLVIEGQASGEVVMHDPDTLTLMVLACIQGLTAGAIFMPSQPGPDPEIVLRMIKA